MKTIFNSKIREKIALILALVIVAGLCAPTKKAHALFGEGDTVSDPLTEVETTLSAISNSLSAAYADISSYAEDSIWLKDYVLDPLAWAVAKSLLQDITDQTVNWINTGFNGNPLYVTNPTSLFNNIANQATYSFISDQGPLSSLCSPISLNVRLAVALSQAGSSGGNSSSTSNGSSGGSGSNSPYACTLSTVINNVQGATINGFEAGDFSQGGWPAFAALAEPQNNFYGAYTEAEDALSSDIEQRAAEQNNQLNRGQGFLSYTTCTDDPTLTVDDAIDDPTIQYDSATDEYEDCQISTPGSTIKASLDKALGSSQDSLVQASMLDEVIGALASKLVNQVLGTGGLSGVTQSQNGNTAYLSQVESETSTANSSTVSNLTSSLTTEISTYEPYATKEQGIYASSVDLVTGATDTFANYAATCYDASNTDAVSTLDGYIATTTNLVDSQLQPEYDSITNYINNLNTLSSDVSSASSASDVSSITGQINSLQPALNSLPSAEVAANTETTDISNGLDGSNPKTIMANANALVAECGGTPSLVTVSGTAANTYANENNSNNGNTGLGPSF
ncbi:MAG: hypothetical protein P4L61_03860 [Candidatus Pacebacteria bacterium]|nr:hypothetical protein [Candidatus Paceibacterota bacterium]